MQVYMYYFLLRISYSIVHSRWTMSSDLRLTPVVPTIIRKKIGDGIDHRFIEDKNISMSTILENYYKHVQLKNLRDPRLSIFDKLRIAEEIERDSDDCKYTQNITKGGLWKDWANEIMMF